MAPHLLRLRSVPGHACRVALIGDQAMPLAHALAADPALSVFVVQPGASAAVPPDDRMPADDLRALPCAGWATLPATVPPVDLLAVVREAGLMGKPVFVLTHPEVFPRAI